MSQSSESSLLKGNLGIFQPEPHFPIIVDLSDECKQQSLNIEYWALQPSAVKRDAM